MKESGMKKKNKSKKYFTLNEVVCIVIESFFFTLIMLFAR